MSPRQLRPAEPPGLHRQARRRIPPAGDLPARQPLLAHAVERTGDLPRPVHPARRLLLLVDTPARHLTRCLPRNRYRPGRSAEAPEGRARYRSPEERDQATIWSERAGPIAHLPVPHLTPRVPRSTPAL